jgi:hypothetical protein
MGYSARYHATSLIAVFIALAVGILIGAEFGGDALTNTRRDLEHSLVGNLQDERSRVDDLNAELNRSDELAERVYPVLVRDRLAERRFAILALGNLPSDITGEVEEALAPTGGRLVGVGVVREPVDVNGLAEDLSQTRLADLRTNPDALTELGTGLGRQLVIGGTLPKVVRGHLFSRTSGTFGALDGVIVVRDQPEEMGAAQREKTNQLEAGLMNGITRTKVPAVGVETSTDDSSSISFFQSSDLASVDDVDLTAGKLAMVFAMLGSDGSFGVKGTADQLLPDLLSEGE